MLVLGSDRDCARGYCSPPTDFENELSKCEKTAFWGYHVLDNRAEILASLSSEFSHLQYVRKHHGEHFGENRIEIGQKLKVP